MVLYMGLFTFHFECNINAFFFYPLGTTLFEHGMSASKVQIPNFGYNFNLEPQFVRILFFFILKSTHFQLFNP